MIVDVQPVLLADVVQVIDTLPVFVIAGRIHLDDGVQTLASAVDHDGDRQLQLAHDGILLLDGHGVGFDECISKLRDVLVFDAFTIQRIESYPSTGSRVIITEDRPDIAVAFI